MSPRELPNLTEGSLSRNLWRLALPTMASASLSTLFSIVDMIFVGRLGPSAVAAVGLGGTFVGMALMLGMGIYIGTVAVVSRCIGMGNQREAEHVATQSLFLALFLGIGMAALVYPLAPWAIRLLGGEPDVVAQGAAYLRVAAAGSTVMFAVIALYAVLRGVGDVVTPLVVNLIAVAFNVALDPIMIFGLLGFPRLGVAGSALATLTARSIGALILLYVLFLGKHPIRLRVKELMPDLGLIWRLVKVGVFSSTEMLFRNLSVMVMYRLVAGFGTEAVAANAIVMRLRSTVIVSGWGLGTSAATLVGQNLGVGKPRRAERAGWLAVAYYSVIAIAAGILFLVLAEQLLGIFTDNPEVVRLGAIYVRISALGVVFLGMTVVLGRAMGGAGDTLSPMVIGTISVALRVGFAIALSLLFKSVVGVWVGRTVANAVNSLVIGVWFSVGLWKKKKV